MPRFHVIAFDVHEGDHCNYIGQFVSASDAVCHLPWLEEIYKPEWVLKNIYATDVHHCISNCKQLLNWAVVCVNLDEEIMKDLNGGDSSVYSPMLQD